MNEQNNQPRRQVGSRRRKRSQFEVFKEAYLPAIIAGTAVVLILIFIIGAISRSISNDEAEESARLESSAVAQLQQSKLQAEAEQLISDANALAEEYKYDEAIEKINSFTGDIHRFPELADKLLELEDIKSNLVAWDDPGKVVNLTFQMLIADPSRAFTNADLGSAYNRNFVTVEEFSNILKQLYQNGYMLVDMEDIVAVTVDETGTETYQAKTLYLPAGKKPLMITQAQVNYYSYMIDGNDNDNLPDKDGAGFASKLVVDENGNIFNEMVDANGNTVNGRFDLVPILEDFIKRNPDFSYQGARAIISVTGSDGLFGYRTHAGAKNEYGLTDQQYNDEIAGARKVADALRDKGYTLACYTYDNRSYGGISAGEIRTDLSGWISEVEPIIGKLDVLVFARDSDISENTTYSGEKYEILANAGFRYYISGNIVSAPWASITNDYVRIGRLTVCGMNMAHNASWFNGIFDAAAILDPNRGSVPQ